MAEIKIVTIDELRQMNDQEGLILQGCGGDLQEWVDGINELFAQAGILQAGSAWKAKAVRSFQYDGLTNLLFPFAGVLMDVGKLAMWRLQTREQFGGTWLSDYVPNRRATSSGSYNEALCIISEYLETELSTAPKPQKSVQKKGRDAHER